MEKYRVYTFEYSKSGKSRAPISQSHPLPLGEAFLCALFNSAVLAQETWVRSETTSERICAFEQGRILSLHPALAASTVGQVFGPPEDKRRTTKWSELNHKASDAKREQIKRDAIAELRRIK